MIRGVRELIITFIKSGYPRGIITIICSELLARIVKRNAECNARIRGAGKSCKDVYGMHLPYEGS